MSLPNHLDEPRSRGAKERDSARETPLGALSLHDIRDATSKAAFEKASRYQRQGRVVSLGLADDGAQIKSSVRGSGPRPYTQTIDFKERKGGSLSISGVCSCPVGFNCKHVAAALLEALDQRDDLLAGDAPAARATSDIGIVARPQPTARRGNQDGPISPAIPVLAPELSNWIGTLELLGKTETEEYPPDIPQRLVYVLDVEKREAGVPHLLARPTTIRLRKDGSVSDKSNPFDINSLSRREMPKFLRPSDRDILKRLCYLPRTVAIAGGVALSGEDGAQLLAAMIATGRARLGSPTGAALSQGAPLNGNIVWQLTDDGSHIPAIRLDNGACPVRLVPPWYLDAGRGVLGPIETGLAPRVAAAILSAPQIPPQHGALVRAAFSERLPLLTALEPPPAPRIVTLDEGLVPCLRLSAREVARTDIYGRPIRGAPTEQMPVARLAFRYGALELAARDPRSSPTFARDGHIVEVKRKPQAERRALSRLADMGFERIGEHDIYASPKNQASDFMLAEDEDGAGWFDVLYEDVPALRAEGWLVEIDEAFPVRLVRAEDSEIEAKLREGSGIDWFDLDLGVVVDGERVDLVPSILAAIESPGFDMSAAFSDETLPMYLPLPDGRVLAMPAARLAPIIAALHELFAARGGPAQDGLGLSILDAPTLAALDAAAGKIGLVWHGGERLREIGRLLHDPGGIPKAELPATFAGTLRQYQARGVDWLQFLRAAGLGGVLADDMGLGKTVQTLAHLAIEKAQGRLDRPALIVAPTSLVANWRREAERFAPGLRVLTLHGADRKARFGEIGAHDLVVTTYPLLARDHAALTGQAWHIVALDEAQTIKNPDAITARLVTQLEARQRLCLTGTPIENHLGELWSLFAFLSPGFLGDRKSFNRRWRVPIEKKGDGVRQARLARRVRPFLLRRTKAEVATDLPARTEIIESVEMEPAQRDLYESVRLAMHDKVRAAIAAKGLARSHIVVLDALLKMRQVCCDPRLLKLAARTPRKAGSAKLERLMDMLPTLIEDGRRVLLFSQFTSMLALIEEELAKAALPYVLLTGDTRDRATPIERFQSGAVPLFLISLKAGGLGLNLTAADTVIHYDPWWNPAVEDQATDRAHRIGQVKPVFVHKLVMLGSIEEKMDALKARKRALAQGLFDRDGKTALDITEADIEAIFAPISPSSLGSGETPRFASIID